MAGKAEAPLQRLVSGNSGEIPSHVNMDSDTRTIMKVGGVANDANTVVETGKELGRKQFVTLGILLIKEEKHCQMLDQLQLRSLKELRQFWCPWEKLCRPAGKGVKGLTYLAEGENGKAATEAGKIAFGFATNSLTGAAIKQSKAVGNITNATEETISETVLGGIGTFFNKVIDYFTNEED